MAAEPDERRGPPRLAPVPSPTATRRLQRGLRSELEAYRDSLVGDLGALPEGDDRHRTEEHAVRVLEHHAAELDSLRCRVADVVAGAVAEREAEAVIDRVTADPPEAPSPSTTGSALRRGACLATAAALIALFGVVSLPPRPPDPLLAAVAASEQALDAAEQAAEGANAQRAVRPADTLRVVTAARELRSAISGLPSEVLDEPEVREWLAVVIADQRRALIDLLGRVPAVERLVADLDQLAEALDIRLPERRAGTVGDVGEVLEPQRRGPSGNGAAGSDIGHRAAGEDPQTGLAAQADDQPPHGQAAATPNPDHDHTGTPPSDPADRDGSVEDRPRHDGPSRDPGDVDPPLPLLDPDDPMAPADVDPQHELGG